MFTEANITAVANQLMRAVVASGAVTTANIDRAVDVLRAELKALLFDARYAGERDLVAKFRGHEQVVLNIVTAECIKNLRAAA